MRLLSHTWTGNGELRVWFPLWIRQMSLMAFLDRPGKADIPPEQPVRISLDREVRN